MDLSWLPEETRSLIQRAVEAITRGAGEKLASISLVGSAVQPVRHEPPFAPRLLVVLTDAPVAAIANLAHQMAEVTAAGLELKVMTKRDVLRGADVFALELADYQLRHHVLVGRDPLDRLFNTPDDLRTSIEREVRSMLRRTRDAIAAGEDHVGERLLREMARLVVVGHQVLIMMDQPPAEPTERAVLEALATLVGASAESLLRALDDVRGGRAIEPIRTLGELLVFIDAVVDFVDSFGPESQSMD